MVIFCGGNGCASIIRELAGRPGVDLVLLVNSYDDGKSTGQMRDFVPGMPGPSDFRKNLARLLECIGGPNQSAIGRLLEYRLPPCGHCEGADFLRRLAQPAGPQQAIRLLCREIGCVIPHNWQALQKYIWTFLRYCDERSACPELSDCSLGNLFFAGAFIGCKRNFNRAVRDMAALCDSPARLVNIDSGIARFLVGLKVDGQILWSEADIVGPQSAVAISEIFLLPQKPSSVQREEISALSCADKLRRLRAWDSPASVSREANQAIRSADVIVYGPGTQFSSLLPSYRVAGVGDAIRASRASVKVLVTNLRHDYDIQSLDCATLVSSALAMMGDAENRGRSVTHVLQHAAAGAVCSDILPWGVRGVPRAFRGAEVVLGHFEGPAGVHDGVRVVDWLLAIAAAGRDAARMRGKRRC